MIIHTFINCQALTNARTALVSTEQHVSTNQELMSANVPKDLTESTAGVVSVSSFILYTSFNPLFALKAIYKLNYPAVSFTKVLI